jgi:small nuclear ribonucleoprotein B and B'
MPRQNKMMQLVNQRLRITLEDSRTLVGQLLAFDKHMNLVVSDVEEFRQTKKGDQRRSLGLLVLRGKHIVGITAEGVPDANPTRTPVSQMKAAPGRAGSNIPAPGAPLTGPAPGMFTGTAAYHPPPPM